MTDEGNGKSDSKIMQSKSGHFDWMLLNDKSIECYTYGKKDHKSTKCFKSSNK